MEILERPFEAFRVSEKEQTYVHSIAQRSLSDLPPNEVLVKVHYSAINYKDLLSSKGNKGVTKSYPHTPGIDAAGVVEEDRSLTFAVGTEVIVMGYDLGMNTDGGFGQYIRVPASWVLAKPSGISLKESMILGTGALTAALGIDKMVRMGQTPEMGPIVVSGATGGVGSFAVEILSRIGFEVWASTGKVEEADYLKTLGAQKIIHRDELIAPSNRPLLRPRWGGAFDTVGGDTLVGLLKACSKEGSIATCGNVTGGQLSMTCLPFILNGIHLLGINAADTRMEVRKRLWGQLASIWKPAHLEQMATTIELGQLSEALESMSQGLHKGRFVVSLNP